MELGLNIANQSSEQKVTPFNEVHLLCDGVSNLRGRIELLSAHLVGAAPPATGGAVNEKSADGVLNTMRDAVASANTEIKAAHEALERIERMVL